jgi:hypothetical protein
LVTLVLWVELLDLGLDFCLFVIDLLQVLIELFFSELAFLNTLHVVALVLVLNCVEGVDLLVVPASMPV